MKNLPVTKEARPGRHAASRRYRKAGRALVAGAWSLLLAAALPVGPASAVTDAALLDQVPGYYRVKVGDLQVTAVFDGLVPLPRNWLTNVTPAEVATRLDGRFVPEVAEGFQTAVNAFIVQRGRHLTLVDAGTSNCFGPGLGQVVGHLRQAGYRPEDVDAVLVTHAHPDHLCGVLGEDGKPAYPNATLWIAGPDVAYWTDAAHEASAPEPMRPLFGMARRAIAPYEAAGRLRRFEPGADLPGIEGARALATPGHTPGHVSFLFDGGGGQQLLVWGDVLHYHAVQFANPQAAFEADLDRPAATRSRIAMLTQAASRRWWV
jgi:glyoxylase-like metal-dependent hydrolase (beta-lactamase superfamily II)